MPYRKFVNKKTLPFLILSGVFFGLFVIFSFIVKKDTLTQFDFNTTVSIQNNIPKDLDTLLSYLSLIGSFEVTMIVLVLLLMIRRKLVGFLTIGIFALIHVVEIIGKGFLTHPGPPYFFFRYDLGFLFPSTYIQPGYSYPSGHAMRSVFIMVIAAYLIATSRRLPQISRYFLLITMGMFMGVMLVSRVSLGEHWSTDVIGGALLGISGGILSLLFLSKSKVHGTK
ncbi:MAG: phosphatase PAP2 family protein [bacterium]|nr:phosphatase PAP2 family protein [bacterium]